MIKLVFITGGAIRRVFIKERVITIIAAEISNKPLTVNLDKIDEQQEDLKKMKLSEHDIKMIHELAELGTEEEMAEDVITDFQKTGWRLIKRD